MPSLHWRGDALDLNGAEVTVLEETAGKPMRAGADDDRVRFGQAPQPVGQVRRLAGTLQTAMIEDGSSDDGFDRFS